MQQRNLKKCYLLSPALALAIFVFSGGFAHAAETMVLRGADQEFSVSANQLSEWKVPSRSSYKYISFEPEKNLNAFIAQELGSPKPQQKLAHFESYNVASIYTFLKNIEEKINRDPVDAHMNIENERVKDFDPGTNGRSLDIKQSIDSIIASLDSDVQSSDLVVNETEPQKTLAQANQLGIKELVAFGESNFAGSPANRIHNIKVGVEKEKGIIVKPGETFSFNQYLGPVDGEHGFLPELVIKKTGTVPEFGGGLCQVSSTVFRAAMNAGLPITERRNHSYAVQYYAPQGTDATIYPGVQDLKFVNNTENNLLIWPVIEKNKLRFYLYGTKDQRKVVVDDPIAYDKKASGAMKATWSRTVTMPDGTELKDTFKSVYQPPALFHKVETFPSQVNTSPEAPSPSTPVTEPNPNPTPTETPPAINQ